MANGGHLQSDYQRYHDCSLEKRLPATLRTLHSVNRRDRLSRYVTAVAITDSRYVTDGLKYRRLVDRTVPLVMGSLETRSDGDTLYTTRRH